MPSRNGGRNRAPEPLLSTPTRATFSVGCATTAGGATRMPRASITMGPTVLSHMTISFFSPGRTGIDTGTDHSLSDAAERWASGAAGSGSEADAGSRRLPGRAGGYPPGPPTDPYVRNSRIRFLRQSGCCPSTVHWPSVVRGGELYVSSLSLASGCSARRRLPSRGSLGPYFRTFTGTMRRYDCHRAPLGSLRLSLASRYLACFSRLWCPRRARCPVEAPRQRQGLWSPGPPHRV